MTTLRLNSIPHEYYLGDLPGTMQYKKTVGELTSITNIDIIDDNCGYVQIPVTPELLPCFIPKTKSGRDGDWQLLVVFRRDDIVEERGREVWMKGALLNRRDGRIALITTTNNEQNILSRGNRALKTMSNRWFVGFYRMGAPMIFWQTVAAAVSALAV